MIRRIVCSQWCIRKWSKEPRYSDPYSGPPETVLIVTGPLLVHCHCDDCNRQLHRGTVASCVSISTEHRPYYAWEHEFIHPVEQAAGLLKSDGKA